MLLTSEGALFTVQSLLQQPDPRLAPKVVPYNFSTENLGSVYKLLLKRTLGLRGGVRDTYRLERGENVQWLNVQLCRQADLRYSIKPLNAQFGLASRCWVF